MPEVIRIGPYIIYFYSNENQTIGEPPHVHVIDRGRGLAKFWLSPVEFADGNGFNKKELKRIEKIVKENENLCLEKWNEYFGKDEADEEPTNE
jgi:Domain of unknown function (DUF4160)